MTDRHREAREGWTVEDELLQHVNRVLTVDAAKRVLALATPAGPEERGEGLRAEYDDIVRRLDEPRMGNPKYGMDRRAIEGELRSVARRAIAALAATPDTGPKFRLPPGAATRRPALDVATLVTTEKDVPAPDSGAEEGLRAALPDGWSFWQVTEYAPDPGQPRKVFARVRTADTIDRRGNVPEVSADGPTLVAAVDAFLSALSGGSVDEERDSDE